LHSASQWRGLRSPWSPELPRGLLFVVILRGGLRCQTRALVHRFPQLRDSEFAGIHQR